MVEKYFAFFPEKTWQFGKKDVYLQRQTRPIEKNLNHDNHERNKTLRGMCFNSATHADADHYRCNETDGGESDRQGLSDGALQRW
jgi:hypothetical protein